MKITSWGTRGSLPTPGKNTQKYGGNTTCIEIKTDRDNLIIIDAGSGIRNLGKKIITDKKIENINLILTHAHWDHLLGFPFFIPAYFSKYNIYVRGGKYAKSSLQKYLKHQMEPPYFPVNFNLLNAKFNFKKSKPVMFKDDPLEVISIKLNHPDGGFGYKFIENGKTFVFLTDNELDYHHKKGPSKAEFIDFCKDADILFHDSQYTNEEYKNTKGWGHSTFESTVDLAIKANVKSLGFTHHDPDRTDDDLDLQVIKYQKVIDKSGKNFKCFGVKEGSTIEL